MDRGISAAEKYAEIGGRENAPRCECHGVTMLWACRHDCSAGGKWICRGAQWREDKRHWTSEEDALLGRLPDKRVAKELGRSLSAVQQRRQKLGVDPVRLTLEQRREVGRRAAAARLAGSTHEQRIAVARQIWERPGYRQKMSAVARRREASRTPGQRSEVSRKREAAKSPEQRSARGRKAAATIRDRHGPEFFTAIARRGAAAKMEKTTFEQRSAAAREANRLRWEGMTAEQRRAAMPLKKFAASRTPEWRLHVKEAARRRWADPEKRAQALAAMRSGYADWYRTPEGRDQLRENGYRAYRSWLEGKRPGDTAYEYAQSVLCDWDRLDAGEVSIDDLLAAELAKIDEIIASAVAA